MFLLTLVDSQYGALIQQTLAVLFLVQYLELFLHYMQILCQGLPGRFDVMG